MGPFLRIRRQELAVLALVAATVLALAWFVANDLRQSANDDSQLYTRLSRGYDLIDRLDFQSQEVRRILLYSLHTSDANLQLRYAEQSRAADAQVQMALDNAARAIADANSAARIETISRAWRSYLVVRDDVIGLILEGSLREGVALDEHAGTERFKAVGRAIADLKRTFEDDAAAQVRAARTRARRATIRLMLMVASALIAAAVGIHLMNRRAALEGLLRVEAHRGSILEAVPGPIISTDASGRITELNDAAARTFGLDRRTVVGQPVVPTMLAEGAPAALVGRQPPVDAAARVVWPRIETVGRRSDGTEFPIEVAAVTHTAGGEQIWTAHVADLTERRVIEKQLRRAKDAAESADRAKTEFLATMSHELRTPLSGLIGVADLLNVADLTPRNRELVEVLRSSASALLSLVSDVLDYSRIEAGLMTLMPTTFSVESLVEEAFDPLAGLAACKGLDTGYVVDRRVPAHVVADAGRVRQVLLNLLSNAVKFTERGEVAVEVGATSHGDRVTVSFTVRDTGIGIPPEHHHRLFQRFSQLHADTSRTLGGTGLGLAISARLSCLLGGEVSVNSAAGRGSTFMFSLAAEVAGDDQRYDDGGLLEGMHVLALVGPGIVGEQIQSLLDRWDVLVTRAGLEDAERPPAGDMAVDAVVVDREAFDGRLYRWAMTHRAAWGASPVPVLVVSQLRSAFAENPEACDTVLVKPVKARALYLALATVRGRTPSLLPRLEAPELFTPGALTILLVEDNDANRRVVHLMLAELGLLPDEASGGADAVQQAAQRNYDVILMDMQMPTVDGLEAARRIRARGGHQPIILALTANVRQGDEARCREAGMNGFLAKPIGLAVLAAALAPLARKD